MFPWTAGLSVFQRCVAPTSVCACGTRKCSISFFRCQKRDFKYNYQFTLVLGGCAFFAARLCSQGQVLGILCFFWKEFYCRNAPENVRSDSLYVMLPPIAMSAVVIDSCPITTRGSVGRRTCSKALLTMQRVQRLYAFSGEQSLLLSANQQCTTS